MPVDPKSVVAEGYDALGALYREWAATIPCPAREGFVGELLHGLPAAATVVELGCGPGVPVGREVSRRHRYLGVDLSPTQLELARRGVSEGVFVQADAAEVQFRPGSIDAVISLYCLNHLPREELPGLLASISAWLRPGGRFLANFPTSGDPGTVESDWLGVRMFFAGFDADTNLELIRGTDVHVARAEIVRQVEFGHPVEFLWVLGQRV